MSDIPKLGMDMTVGEVFEMLRKHPEVGTMKIVMRDGNQTPTAAMIVVAGKAETTDILYVVEQAEDEWEGYAE